MKNEMTMEQYKAACEYTDFNLEDYEIATAIDFINYYDGIFPDYLTERICDLMDEWCFDHDLEHNDWMDFGNTKDVFEDGYEGVIHIRYQVIAIIDGEPRSKGFFDDEKEANSVRDDLAKILDNGDIDRGVKVKQIIY